MRRKTMRKKSDYLLIFVVFMMFFTLTGVVCGASKPETSVAPATQTGLAPVHLKFSSHSIGSTWYSYAASISEIIRPLLPAGSTIDVLPYGGGFAGMPLISKGDADLGLGSTCPNSWAFKGTVVFDKKYDNLRALVGGLDEYFLTIVVPKKLNITSVEQLVKTKGLTWMTLPQGSNGKLGAEHILK
jgi:TRAP-type uncharacterized transport system substrate-binding protein